MLDPSIIFSIKIYRRTAGTEKFVRANHGGYSSHQKLDTVKLDSTLLQRKTFLKGFIQKKKSPFRMYPFTQKRHNFDGSASLVAYQLILNLSNIHDVRSDYKSTNKKSADKRCLFII